MQTMTTLCTRAITGTTRKWFFGAALAGAALVATLQAPALASATDAPAPGHATVKAEIRSAPEATAEALAACVAWAVGDDAHLSSGDVSAHGWWLRGTCAGANQALVTVHIQQLWDDGVWRNAGNKGEGRIRPREDSNNRITARVPCLTSVRTGWRSIVDVDIVGFADTPNRVFTPRQDLACRH
jgi:hypothetical protein